MKKKKYATIQIDVDGLWVIYQHFGYKQYASYDVLYEKAFPRFLEFFAKYNIKATLFVVGRDLLVPARLGLLKKAVRAGHEIANHTMNHAEGFSFLSTEQKKKEIMEAHTLIESSLEVIPVGFRTPSNDVDEETLKILEDNGYLYDSSVMPTYYGPLLRSIKFHTVSIERKHSYLGKTRYGRAPLHPYHPDPHALEKKGPMRLLEIPISTMPLLRLPFHTSFVMATAHLGFGSLLFSIGSHLFNMVNAPLNFVFHTNELSEPIHAVTLKRQYGLDLPIYRKERICNKVMRYITSHYECIRSRDLAELTLKKLPEIHDE